MKGNKKIKKYIKSNNVFDLLENYVKDELNNIYLTQEKKINDCELQQIFKQKYVNNKNITTLDKNIISDKKILCISKNKNDYELIKFILNEKISNKSIISYNHKIEEINDIDIILLDSDVCLQNNEINKFKKSDYQKIIILGNIVPKFINLGISYFVTRPFNTEKIIYNISNIILKHQ